MVSFWTILLRLGLALLLGAAVGLEREQREHGAGMRTVALVTLGAALFTVVSAYGFLDLAHQQHLSLDPTRIASYIVAGIGFLGAGTIFMSRDREKVKGLTTAATIWVMAAVGIACGIGLLLEAAVTTLLTLSVLVGLHILERRLLLSSAPGSNHIHIETTLVNGEFLSKVYEVCARDGLIIAKLRIHQEEGREVVELTCQIEKAASLGMALADLRALPGILAIQSEQPGTSEPGTILSRAKK